MTLTPRPEIVRPQESDSSGSSVCSADFRRRKDDCEPLTDSWFSGGWPQEFREDNYAIECDCGWFEVYLYGEEARGYSLSGNEWDGVRFKTRGDIRRFLWYLEAVIIP